MHDNVLIVGGGIAGISAGTILAREGLKVHIVERDVHLGGHVASFCCKGTDRCNKCMVCRAMDQFNEITATGQVTFHFNSEVSAFKGSASPYEVEITGKPAPIDENTCIRCGLCATACKAAAVALNHSCIEPRFYHIDREKCVRTKGEDCTACRDICPISCIDFRRSPKKMQIQAEAVIVSTGYEPFDAGKKPQLGHGRFPHVITAGDLEAQLMAHGGIPRRSDGTIPQKMAFIQCVGSRDPHAGRNYCSRVCCGYAMRMARLILHSSPGTSVTMFYIDIQSFGKDFLVFMEEMKKNERFRLIKGVPATLYESGQGIRLEFEDMLSGKNVDELFDLVVLSTGMGPCDDAEAVAGLFSLQRDEDGFFCSRDRGAAGKSPGGVFTAGSCSGPGNISWTILDAQKTAAHVISYLRR